MRHATGVATPCRLAAVNPRGCLCCSVEVARTSLCPSFSASTEITLSWPTVSAPAGNANVLDPVAHVPRKRPLIHAEHADGPPPVAQLSDAPLSPPLAMKCPRYQTSP